MDVCDLPESFPSLKLFSASASELAAEPKGVGSMQSGIVALAAGAVWFGFVFFHQPGILSFHLLGLEQPGYLLWSGGQ